ncbi:MAG: hypothetical protein K1X74_14920 [Pirellulales bacterium]|nr:hypothetical protein [Pirellulales bacterium]
MKRLLKIGALMLLLVPGLARAQESEPAPASAGSPVISPPISLGELQPTPEMWFYQEMIRRNDDPKVAVRQRAARSAQARQNRIESRRWFGLSNSRPAANPTPSTSRYAHGWVSGSWHRNEWVGSASPLTALRGSIPRY